MITLNIDLTTTKERKEQEIDFLDDTMGIIDFENLTDLLLYTMCELDSLDEKVYLLSYGGDEYGVVFVDHLTCNIISNMQTQLSEDYDVENVFLFACDNYNEAYELASEMKEATGMLDYQLNVKYTEEPTVANGGIVVTSLKN